MGIEYCDNHALLISGRIFKMAAVRDEPYECLSDVEGFITKLRRSGIRVDLLTFMQEISEAVPRYSYYLGWEPLAAVPVSTFDNWWKKQIDGKTRNMIRKAQKNGVEFRRTGLTDEFIHGVCGIYNESPVRQGEVFWHYGKSFDEVKKKLSTFPERSEFVGAYYEEELIGFIKFVRGKDAASLMHIISKFAHRDKAPTNGLVAKAVEMCAEQGLQWLHYSVWGRRRGLSDFKKHTGFIQHNVPRYYVPLNWKGKLMLRLNCHRKFAEFLPQRLLDVLVSLRSKWRTRKVVLPAISS